jgi:hypothetical protein
LNLKIVGGSGGRCAVVRQGGVRKTKGKKIASACEFESAYRKLQLLKHPCNKRVITKKLFHCAFGLCDGTTHCDVLGMVQFEVEIGPHYEPPPQSAVGLARVYGEPVAADDIDDHKEACTTLVTSVLTSLSNKARRGVACFDVYFFDNVYAEQFGLQGDDLVPVVSTRIRISEEGVYNVGPIVQSTRMLHVVSNSTLRFLNNILKSVQFFEIPDDEDDAMSFACGVDLPDNATPRERIDLRGEMI